MYQVCTTDRETKKSQMEEYKSFDVASKDQKDGGIANSSQWWGER